ncbi:MAG: hypothetical protein WC071_09950 [Victivallaceae bacterium]
MYKRWKKLECVMLLLALALFAGRDLVHPLFHRGCCAAEHVMSKYAVADIPVIVDSGHEDMHNWAGHVCSICSSCAMKFCSPDKILCPEQFFDSLFNLSPKHSSENCSILSFSSRAPPAAS